MKNADEIIAAIQAGDAAKLQSLLQQDPASATARDAAGVSALMHTVYRRRDDLRDLLLATSPSLDVFEATALGRTGRLTELLSQEPALAKAWSADGFTPLHLAAFFNQETAARLLLQSGAEVAAVARNPMKVMPLHSAAAGRSLAVVRALVEHGALANARQEQGWTALHAAAQDGDKPMVELLLKHGADRALANDQGATALSVAREKGHTEIVNLLTTVGSAT